MGSIAALSQHGKRLLHVTIDEIAWDDPDRPYASLPYDDDNLSKGYEDITFAVLANAINKLAWHIQSCLGTDSDLHTYTYIGTPDLRYQIMSMATAKLSKRVLFSSHMHSTEAHLNLMFKTDTRAMFTATGVDVSDILAARPVPHFHIPSLEELLSPTATKHYPYSKTFSEAALDDYLVLHSSGSTGLPKPITVNHAAMACLDNIASLPSIDPHTGQQRRFANNPGPGTRFLLPFLPFHGICCIVFPPAFVFHGAVYVPGLRHRLTKPTDIFSILDHANITDAFLSPAIIEDIVSHPSAGTYLSKIRTLFFGGAAMNATAATTAAKYTNLQNQWGVTENGKAVDLLTSASDHAYNAFDLVAAGMRFQPLPSTDPTQPVIYQLFFDPTPEALPQQAYFTRLPARETLEPFDTGDLWLAHPDPAKAKFTFRFIGRTDDLISFKDGSNFHPTDWELAHAEHPLVRSAVLAGVGHRQVLLLLELHPEALGTTDGADGVAGQRNEEEVLEKLWRESISRVNARAPGMGGWERGMC
ncbi:uncharacterized protein AB675_8542 [Cyphellophora attinorum]|uniref:AMP-dependent synthetase/ligase domain-containing protein n=1 Tax=Cyphellophora attinorum TaxID=1664694 RepID=A0A0N1P198_9EURO|nr:uncharacterized protein AB675_8542 [Phialophora attinorum]KPI44515.1 hypothetical protein AB675_8542 [Phialophora attinorum]